MGDKLLFLSHAGVDSAAALALAERIERSGLKVWIDKRDLAAGRGWQQQLEEVIDKQSTAFAVYVGGRGVVNWVDSEVRVALARATGNADYPFIPVLAKGVEPAALPAFARQFQGVQDVEGDADALQKLVRAALGEADRAPLALETQPFLGLSAFDEAHTHLFFGRESETEELVGLLRKTTLLMVVGDSGSGKSSLVKAGLIPRFRGGAFAPAGGERPDETPWHVVQMRPLGAPFEKLTDAVSEAARAVGIDVETRLALGKAIRTRDADTIRDALREGAPPKAQTLLVVDQFEELWTLTDEPARMAFLDALLALARPGDGTYRVVLTMRRDYYNLCSQHPALFVRLEDGQVPAKYSVRRMSDEALRRCIAQPLLLAGVADAATYADAVLKDVGDQPGELALLEMALTEAWRRRAEFGGDLLKAYINIGRVSGALANAAEDVFRDRLNDDERRRAEAIFMRLVRLGDTGGTTRRIAAKAEFRDDGWTLAQRLAQEDHKRLLFVGADTAEIAHEALVTQWPRYQSWLQQAAADKRKLDGLMDDAKRWAVAPAAAKAEFLARGYDLDNGLSLLGDPARKAWLSDAEIAFIEASDAERKREESERKEARKERERLLREQAEASKRLADEQSARAVLAETSRRKIRRWFVAAGALAVVATVAAGIAVVFVDRLNTVLEDLRTANDAVEERRKEAVAAREEAERQAKIAFVRQLSAQARQLSLEQERAVLLERGAALAVEAIRRGAGMSLPLSPDVDAAVRELQARLPYARLVHDGSRVTQMEWNSQGDRLATTGDSNVVSVWTAAGGGQPVRLDHGTGFWWFQWNSRGDRLATGGATEQVKLWAADGSGEAIVLQHEKPVSSMAWSPLDDRLATRDFDGTVRLWTADGRGEPVVLPQDAPVTSTAWSPRGDRIATLDENGSVRLHASNGQGEPLLLTHGDAVKEVAWNARSDALAALGTDSTVVKVWRIDDGGEPILLRHEAAVTSLSWSPRGARLTTVSGGGKAVSIWDVDGPDEPVRYPHEAAVWSVEWHPQADRLATLDENGVVRIWGGEGTAVTIEHGDWVSKVIWSPDGKRLATSGRDGLVKLWATEAGSEPLLLAQGERVAEVAWSPEGDVLATCDSDTAVVKLWRTNGSGEPIRLSDGEPIWFVDWSPRGDLVAAAGDRSLRVWASDSRGDPRRFEQSVPVSVLEWSPRGEWIAAGDESTVKLLPADGEGDPVSLDHGGQLAGIRWNPQGERLATWGYDGVVNLWGSDGQGDPTTIEASVPVTSMSWSPGGDRLAVSSGRYGDLDVWAADGKSEPVRVGTLTQAEEVAWGPQGDRIATLRGDVSLWPANGEGEPIKFGDNVEVIAWSPKGDRLATVDGTGVVELRAGDGQGELLRFEHGGPVAGMDWSPDSQRLVTGGKEGAIRLWPADGRGQSIRLTHGAPILTVAWSPRGDRLATLGEDDVVSLWAVSEDLLTRLLCSRAGRNLSAQEWRDYINAEEPWQPTCENWAIPQDVFDAGLWPSK